MQKRIRFVNMFICSNPADSIFRNCNIFKCWLIFTWQSDGKLKQFDKKNMHPQSEQMYIAWKSLVLWKHPRVPNPKPLVANRGWRNYSTHSPYSCHQDPGVTGPVCSPHHTSHVLKGPIKVMTPGVCNCGSASLLSLIGLLVCFPSFFFFCSRFVPNSCLTL